MPTDPLAKRLPTLRPNRLLSSTSTITIYSHFVRLKTISVDKVGGLTMSGRLFKMH